MPRRQMTYEQQVAANRRLAREMGRYGVTRPTQVGGSMLYPDGAVGSDMFPDDNDDISNFSDMFQGGGQRHMQGDTSDRWYGGAEPKHGRFVLETMPAVNKIYRVAGFTAIAPSAGLGQQTNGNAVAHTWAQSGLVVWANGVALATGALAGLAEGQAGLGILIHVAATDEDLIVNGNLGTPDFASFATLFGISSNSGKFPIGRWVVEGEVWTIQCCNRDTANTYLPEVAFGFIRDPRGVRRVAARGFAGR